MTPELQNKLTEKYPFLGDVYLGVGDGWYDLLDTLCGQISQYLNVPGANLAVDVVQIKQKFGGLRFYCDFRVSQDWDGVRHQANGAIPMAEAMSLCICEHCGNRGALCTIKGWMATLCTGCKDGRQ